MNDTMSLHNLRWRLAEVERRLSEKLRGYTNAQPQTEDDKISKQLQWNHQSCYDTFFRDFSNTREPIRQLTIQLTDAEEEHFKSRQEILGCSNT